MIISGECKDGSGLPVRGEIVSTGFSWTTKNWQRITLPEIRRPIGEATIRTDDVRGQRPLTAEIADTDEQR
ncbi:hypothetical protein EVAR_21826_1 [Eumeta japonica]|uniref:Uncharacterized protein n=1 Tax=Eumeta variegata TaxID=151549 RepID=A0A4C1V8T8_EUMVA|nr:hypothetical protein EVAR_21826_1 [Eumeta japonica]